MLRTAQSLTGTLFSSARTFEEITGRLHRLPLLHNSSGRRINENWHRFQFESDVPLLGETHFLEGETFVYPFFCFGIEIQRTRDGVPAELSSVVALLAWSREIYSTVVSTFDFDLRGSFLPVTINIDLLVDEVMAQADYEITFIHARTPTAGDLLRSMSLYGDDIARADLFVRSRRVLNCYICGLHSGKFPGELARLGGDGLFATTDPSGGSIKRTEQVTQLVRYVVDLGFMRF